MSELKGEGLHPAYVKGAERISCPPVLDDSTEWLRPKPSDDDLLRWLRSTYKPTDFNTVGQVRVAAAVLELYFRTGRGRYELALFVGEALIADGAVIADWHAFAERGSAPEDAAVEDAGARAERQARSLTQFLMVATHAEIIAALARLREPEAAGVESLLLNLEQIVPPDARG